MVKIEVAQAGRSRSGEPRERQGGGSGFVTKGMGAEASLLDGSITALSAATDGYASAPGTADGASARAVSATENTSDAIIAN